MRLLSGTVAQDELTIKQLWHRKASAYFDLYRDKAGVPSKTIEECHAEAQEDYPPVKTFDKSNGLDEFNKWRKKRLHVIRSNNYGVVWGDGTYDYVRDCHMCGSALCQIPVHSERYDVRIERTKENELIEEDNA